MALSPLSLDDLSLDDPTLSPSMFSFFLVIFQVCQTAERFYAVSQVLQNMLQHLSQQTEPSARLLKHIVRCYLRLSDNPRAREALQQCLPKVLRDDTFIEVLMLDQTIKKWVTQLLVNVGDGSDQQQVDGVGVLQ